MIACGTWYLLQTLHKGFLHSSWNQNIKLRIELHVYRSSDLMLNIDNNIQLNLDITARLGVGGSGRYTEATVI